MEWSIVCTDPRAIPVLSRLSEVMKIDWEDASDRANASEYCVCLRCADFQESGDTIPSNNKISLPKTIIIAPPPDSEIDKKAWITTAMYRVANRLIWLAQEDECILLHAALAEQDGCGVLLAAPSGTGKTTASSRLPTSWHPLSDDASLVLPAKDGFQVNPWPTWSRFFQGDTGKWDVQDSVPLKGIFLLKQSAQDRLEPVTRLEAFEALIAAHDQITMLDWTNLPADYCREIRTRVFHTISNIVQTVPVYRLHISLNGAFWELIDSVL